MPAAQRVLIADEVVASTRVFTYDRVAQKKKNLRVYTVVYSVHTRRLSVKLDLL